MRFKGATCQGGMTMPLKKLWNSLCGRSTEPKVAEPTPTEPTVVVKAVAEPRIAVPTSASILAAEVRANPQPVASAEPARRNLFSFKAKGEHDGLIRLIRQSRPTSLLEIGVGDGSRMPAILASLAADSTADATADDAVREIKAAVIDQFELGNGTVSLRDYHRHLNGLAVRPAIFPEPLHSGLVRIANRLGRMDVIVVDASVIASVDPAVVETLYASIGKVMHPGTIVLSHQSGKWAPTSIGSMSQSDRRAA